MEGILAIIGIFFVPIVMVILLVWFETNARNKRNQLQADLAKIALEKGQALPEGLFAEPPKKQRKPLNVGIILMAAGVGIALFLWIMKRTTLAGDVMPAVWSVGILPFLIGVGFLIIHFIEKKKATDENAK